MGLENMSSLLHVPSGISSNTQQEARSTSSHLSEDLWAVPGSKSVKLLFSLDDTTVQGLLLEDASKTSSRLSSAQK